MALDDMVHDGMDDLGLGEDSELQASDFLGAGQFEAVGTDDLGAGDEEPQTGKEEVFGAVKKAVPILAIALVGICVAMGFLVSNKGKEKKPKETKPAEVTYEVKENPTVGSSETQVSQNVDGSNWVWVEADGSLTFSEPVSSIFTVTDIKLVSMVIEGQDVMELESILRGSIDGLRGTYEARVPYDLALKVSVGTELNVEYRIGEKGKTKFITGIQF